MDVAGESALDKLMASENVRAVVCALLPPLLCRQCVQPATKPRCHVYQLAVQETFVRLDQDGDGSLTFEEKVHGDHAMASPAQCSGTRIS